MYTCTCNWVTMLYSRKLTEHCKPAIMEKNKNHYIYIYTHTHTHIYIPIYTCVCVCVCVCARIKRMQCCPELWCRLQMQLGSQVAVAVAGSCSSDSTPSLGTSIYCGYSPKKTKKEKRKKEKIYILALEEPLKNFLPSSVCWLKV